MMIHQGKKLNTDRAPFQEVDQWILPGTTALQEKMDIVRVMVSLSLSDSKGPAKAGKSKQTSGHIKQRVGIEARTRPSGG